MKIFISYSSNDYNDIQMIVHQLQQAGHSIWIDRQEISVSTNILSSIKQALEEADIVLAFITENYNASSYASAELGAVLLGSPQKLLAVVIGNAKIPSLMSGILYRKYETFNPNIAYDIISDLKNIDTDRKNSSVASEQEIKLENENKYINELKSALNSNRLTLVCGAGISVSAGIPSWNTLLLYMLNKCVTTKFIRLESMMG